MIRKCKARQKLAFKVSCKDADDQKSVCLGGRKACCLIIKLKLSNLKLSPMK